MDLIRDSLSSGAGWVLIALIALSTASVTVILERMIFFWRRRIDTDAIAAEVDALLAKGEMAEARSRLRGDSLPATVGRDALEHYAWPAPAIEDRYRATLESARLSYDRGLGFLATVGSNAPFVGLFGTVLGIIHVFRTLATAGAAQDRAQLVMGGVGEALVSTAVGILVALPAVMAFNTFQRRTERSLGAAEVLARAILARRRAGDR